MTSLTQFYGLTVLASTRTATGETHFSLVYGSDAVIPAEIIFDSLRTETYDEEKNTLARREVLDLVELNREVAHIRVKKYKCQVKAHYIKKVKTWGFEKGDLLLKRADALKPLAKWETIWEGPLIVTEVQKEGAYPLQENGGFPTGKFQRKMMKFCWNLQIATGSPLETSVGPYTVGIQKISNVELLFQRVKLIPSGNSNRLPVGI